MDGGLLSNFPLELVTSNLPEIQEIVGGESAENADSIGLLLDEQQHVPGQSITMANQKEGGFEHRLARLINAMTSARDRVVIERYHDIVCHLPVGGYGTTEFELSLERREALINTAYRHTKAFLQKKKTIRTKRTRG